MIKAESNKITVAHIRSESGDHFLQVFDGHISWEEISEKVYESAPDWWGEPDQVGTENSEWVQFE